MAGKLKKKAKEILNLSKEQKTILNVVNGIHAYHNENPGYVASDADMESEGFQQWDAAYEAAKKYLDGVGVAYSPLVVIDEVTDQSVEGVGDSFLPWDAETLRD